MLQAVVGTACSENRHVLDISYPISNGQVQDWEGMFKVWDHTFKHVLKLDAAARSRTRILLTEPPLNPLSNRQEHPSFLSSTRIVLHSPPSTVVPTAFLETHCAYGATLKPGQHQERSMPASRVPQQGIGSHAECCYPIRSARTSVWHAALALRPAGRPCWRS